MGKARKALLIFSMALNIIAAIINLFIQKDLTIFIRILVLLNSFCAGFLFTILLLDGEANEMDRESI